MYSWFICCKTNGADFGLEEDDDCIMTKCGISRLSSFEGTVRSGTQEIPSTV